MKAEWFFLMVIKIYNKLYSGFTFVAIISAVIALVRIALGHDAQTAVMPNIVIGGICIAGMMILSYKDRRQVERRN